MIAPRTPCEIPRRLGDGASRRRGRQGRKDLRERCRLMLQESSTEKGPIIIDPIPVEVTLAEVLGQLGHPGEADVSRALKEKADVQMADALGLVTPRGAYLMLEGPPRKGFEMFPGEQGVALGLATIGGALEQRAAALVKERRTAAGAVTDAVGTIAAEHVADFVEARIRQEALRREWKTSRRYAPGFCGWPLEAQKHLVGCFVDALGIRLTRGCLMKPEKSLSFACLLSADGDFGEIKLADCARCAQESCPCRTAKRED